VAGREELTGAVPAGTDLIVHLAAEHKDEGVEEGDYFRVNGQGTANLLAEATRQHVRRFLFVSSVAVYGETPGASEQTRPCPQNPYGHSKLEAERQVLAWAAGDPCHRALILRPTAVYGPGNRANIYQLMKRVHDGRFLMVGSGEHVKSVAYVKNLVAAMQFLLERWGQDSAGPDGEVLNYVDYPQLPLRDLVALIASCSGRRVPALRIPVAAAEIGAGLLRLGARLLGRGSVLSSDRMRKFATPSWFRADRIRELGFRQPFTVEEGLRETIRADCADGRARAAA